MFTKRFFELIEKSVFVGFICSVLLCFSGLSKNCESISDKIIRLHIVANSDLQIDQELKLKIRDKILQVAPECFKITENIDETAENLRKNLNKYVDIAEKEIKNYGFEYPVNVELKRMYFYPRCYEKVRLPGGNYRALSITIGEGKGKNWWCVIFPPMCLPAAEETQELETVLNKNEFEIVQNKQKYEIRFKFLDIFNRAKNWVMNFFKSN